MRSVGPQETMAVPQAFYWPVTEDWLPAHTVYIYIYIWINALIIKHRTDLCFHRSIGLFKGFDFGWERGKPPLSQSVTGANTSAGIEGLSPVLRAGRHTSCRCHFVKFLDLTGTRVRWHTCKAASELKKSASNAQNSIAASSASAFSGRNHDLPLAIGT